MTTFDKAREKYKAKYGTNSPTKHACWVEPMTNNPAVIWGNFIQNTDMKDPERNDTIDNLISIDYSVLVNHILPCLKLIEADMIYNLSGLMPHIPVGFQVGFVQSFATLTREHQRVFIKMAQGVTNGELIASWMADIFFAPVSIINLPPAPPTPSAKTVAHVDLTSPPSPSVRRANSVFSGASSPATPIKTPLQQVSPVRVNASSTAARTTVTKPRVGTVLPGYPKQYVKFSSTTTGKSWTVVAGTVTKFGVVLPDGTVTPYAGSGKRFRAVGVPVDAPADVAKTAASNVPNFVSKQSAPVATKPFDLLASEVIPGYPNVNVECKLPDGTVRVLRAGLRTNLGVVMPTGTFWGPPCSAAFLSGPQPDTKVPRVATTSKKPTSAKPQQPVFQVTPNTKTPQVPKVSKKPAAPARASAKAQQPIVQAPPKPVVQAPPKPVVKAPTPRDPSTALILWTPCPITTKLKVRLQYQKVLQEEDSDLELRRERRNVTWESSSTENVVKNLRTRRVSLETNWPEDMLPEERSFDTNEAAILHAMMHAYWRNYQLVTRFQNGETILPCSRMCPDMVDRADPKSLKVSDRQSCNFALKVEYDAARGGWTLKHIQGRSEHNHAPVVHPLALFANCDIGLPYRLPCYENPTAYFDKLALSCDNNVEVMFNQLASQNYTKPQLLKAIKDRDIARLEGGSPHQALYKLFTQAPFLRAKCRVNNHDSPEAIFISHTEGYCLWRAYPEVMYFNDLGEHKMGGKFQRLVNIAGVDCYDLDFPIAFCVVERKHSGEDIDAPCWRWIFKELKEMFGDYKLPDPEFIQSSFPIDAIKACEKAFPTSHVHMDPEAADDLALTTVRRYFRSQRSMSEALASWDNVVSAEDEYMMDRTMSKIKNCRLCPKGEKKFLTEMKKYMSRVCDGVKNENWHFDVRSNNHYDDIDVIGSPTNIFELVRRTLHFAVQAYNGRLILFASDDVRRPLVTNTLFEDCFRVISPVALRRVEQVFEKLPRLYEGESCYCADKHSTGVPCKHELRAIIKDRKLSPDDFHPHWRLLYVDLTQAPISGKGRHAKAWAALKTGKEVYSCGFTETFKMPRVVKPKPAGKENRPPAKKQRVV